jgi:uncharacterized protein
MGIEEKSSRNSYVLLTGATSGIGYELARLFAMDGFNLILVARSEERLQEITDELKQLYSVEVTPVPKDLFQPYAAYEVYDLTKEMGIQVDVLVNDAGQGQWGPFIETPLERDLEIIQLNITSLVTLTKLFLKDMVARNEGRILQVGSEAGTAPIPLLAVYSATKAFVLSFSAALVNELQDTNITVTALLPGATDTDFFHKAQQEDAVIYQRSLLSPEEVAKDGYEALMKGERKVISGAKAKLHVFLNDLFGPRLSAANNRSLMNPAKRRRRTKSAHAASQEEREFINRQTGNMDGDMETEK